MKDLVAVPQFHYLLHPYSTSLVTTCDGRGRSNVLAIAWLIPVSVDPPLVGMSIRSSRYSYEFLKEVPEFVVNVAPHGLVEQALVCGRRSGREVDKFAATGLTQAKARRVRPPIIDECLAFLECRVTGDVEAGDHRLVIGEVLAAYARPEALGEDGLRNLARIHPLLHVGKDRFTTV